MKSILIAEGDERVAELFAYIFAGDGWTVATFRDGQRAAVALGDTASFDAVLVSNRLRDMGGVELITRIRALDHRKGVPIVMVTGSTEVAIVAAALARGADDVLFKPVDVATLVDTVNKCVERARRERQQILGARPRTVAKHLERIFRQLGVETRTAAASALSVGAS